VTLTATAQAQQPAAPPFATTKVTDNVYIFRYGNPQSMFIVRISVGLMRGAS
jgi:hypothetical protein